MSASDRSQHLEWFEAIEDEGVNLTTWEEDFIESIAPRLKSGGWLSEKQAEILETIYTRRTP